MKKIFRVKKDDIDISVELQKENNLNEWEYKSIVRPFVKFIAFMNRLLEHKKITESEKAEALQSLAEMKNKIKKL